MKRLLLVVAISVALTGCGDDGDDATTTKATGANAVLCPKDVPTSEAFDANSLLGLTLVKARLEAVKYRCEVRPVSVDGRKLANVDDTRDDRVNVALEKGRIVRVLGVY